MNRVLLCSELGRCHFTTCLLLQSIPQKERTTPLYMCCDRVKGNTLWCLFQRTARVLSSSLSGGPMPHGHPTSQGACGHGEFNNCFLASKSKALQALS